MMNPNQLKANKGRRLQQRRSSLHGIQGSSLLEVLVAMVVISLGLLGIAGLSASTFVYNKAAQYRLSGLTVVNDYADRARSNLYGYDRGGYTIAITGTATVPTFNLEMAVPETAADDVAQGDRAELLTAVADRFPGGKAVIASTPTSKSRNLDIWLLWEEPETASGDTLFAAGQRNCPDSADAKYSCMYFSVGL